jgi:D-alanyl-lipoteichoic acid acyltransferase DltB (MBOAT superfamily)
LNWLVSILITFLFVCLSIVPTMANENQNFESSNQTFILANTIEERNLPLDIRNEMAEKISTREIVKNKLADQKRLLSDIFLK